MKLFELEKSKNEFIEELRSLEKSAELEKRNLNEKEKAEFDSKYSKVEELSSKIERLRKIEQAEKAELRSLPADYKKESEKFSLRKAILSLAGQRVDAGREHEISQEIEKRSNKSAMGLYAPYDVFLEKRATVTTTDASGGHLIATDHFASQYTDKLRDATFTGKLGASYLNNLTGNVSIPKRNNEVNGAWFADNTDITEGTATFAELTATPKNLGSVIPASLNTLKQTSPSIDTILRDDLAMDLARVMDNAIINNAGTNAPTSLLSASGVGSTELLAKLTYTNIVESVRSIRASNVSGMVKFLINSNIEAALKLTLLYQELQGTAIRATDAVLRDGMLAGNPYVLSNLVPSDGTGEVASANRTDLSTMYLGDWSQLLICNWGSIDLVVNPYGSQFRRGGLEIRAIMCCDIIYRYPEAFHVITGIDTTI